MMELQSSCQMPKMPQIVQITRLSPPRPRKLCTGVNKLEATIDPSGLHPSGEKAWSGSGEPIFPAPSPGKGPNQDPTEVTCHELTDRKNCNCYAKNASDF
jgi:hypothetical protein